MSKTTFKPNTDWILLPDPVVKKTDSGIYLDDETAQKQSTNILKVLAVGPNVKHIKVGDMVMVDPRTEAVRTSQIGSGSHLLVQQYQSLGIM